MMTPAMKYELVVGLVESLVTMYAKKLYPTAMYIITESGMSFHEI